MVNYTRLYQEIDALIDEVTNNIWVYKSGNLDQILEQDIRAAKLSGLVTLLKGFIDTGENMDRKIIKRCNKLMSEIIVAQMHIAPRVLAGEFDYVIETANRSSRKEQK